MLNFKLCDDLDIDRCNVSFNRSFGFLFKKSNSVSISFLLFIFLWNWIEDTNEDRREF